MEEYSNGIFDMLLYHSERIDINDKESTSTIYFAVKLHPVHNSFTQGTRCDIT